MLLAIFKRNSNRLQDAAKAVFVWPSNEIGFVGNRRTYHMNKRRELLLKRNAACDTVHFPSKLLKCAYSVHPSVSENNSDEPVSEYLKRHDIRVTGQHEFTPILNVYDASLPEGFRDVLTSNKIVNLSPIQSVAWPIVMSGKDFVGISPTGSGKTLAFTVPMLSSIANRKNAIKKNKNSPLALVLAPTRELVQQISATTKWFSELGYRSAAAYGGVSKIHQAELIGCGVDIVIATPGRCNDLLQSQCMSLDSCSFLVLDEADRMLDMGFLPQIHSIITRIPENKQSMMWSATWPKEVIEIANDYLKEYVQISVGSTELKPSKNVHQIVEICKTPRGKLEKFFTFLKETLLDDNTKILVFAETVSDVIALERSLLSKRFPATSIHGRLGQMERENRLKRFRQGLIKIMIATAVAERGLDIDNITHVVNYDCPVNEQQYIHKIGRTGRFDKTGIAITYVTEDNVSAKYLVKILRESEQPVPDELLEITKTGRYHASYSIASKYNRHAARNNPFLYSKDKFQGKHFGYKGKRERSFRYD